MRKEKLYWNQKQSQKQELDSYEIHQVRAFNFIICVMKPAHKKIEKIDQRLINKPLQGGNLLYITQMNNSWMIQMKIPPLYI